MNGPGKKVARRNGHHSEAGGWLYRADGSPIVQGYSAYLSRYSNLEDIWYVLGEKTYLANARWYTSL